MRSSQASDESTDLDASTELVTVPRSEYDGDTRLIYDLASSLKLCSIELGARRPGSKLFEHHEAEVKADVRRHWLIAAIVAVAGFATGVVVGFAVSRAPDPQ